MERHQVDLVDMINEEVEVNGKSYRYILTLQDIFSRYLWLRPLSRKSSSSVAFELKQIYREHGPPKILQCDRGGEFRRHVIKANQKIGVKIVNSRAYHPQSQDKVERSHRMLRDKIRYDILRRGSNWVENLSDYQGILNDEVKRELGGKSPFEIYFTRKSNFVTKPNAESDPESEGEDVLLAPKEWPELKPSDISQIERRRKLLTEATFKASSKCAKTMVNAALKMKPLPIYSLNERVLVRYPFKYGKRAPRKRFGIIAKVMKRNERGTRILNRKTLKLIGCT